MIPFRDEVAVLRRCVASVLERSAYGDFELLLVSNDSTGAGTDFISPWQIALDGSGNILVGDHALLSVLKVDPTSGDRTILSGAGVGSGPSLIQPQGIAVDSSGDIVVADDGRDAVVGVDPANGDRTTLSDSSTGTGPSFSSPLGIAVVMDGSVPPKHRQFLPFVSR